MFSAEAAGGLFCDAAGKAFRGDSRCFFPGGVGDDFRGRSR